MLKNTKVGQKVNCSDFLFENKDIVETDDVYKRINCKSYQKNDDISLSVFQRCWGCCFFKTNFVFAFNCQGVVFDAEVDECMFEILCFD